ncbi:MAG TPA: protein phosphatase 2C domain-containing protein [Roseiarcus sp.]|nr:protein phosphatase 2C domain-containing protein [Roseiarcus sp.]
MTGTLVFDTASASHVGKVRTVNEDGLLARPDLGLWAVADGMGGHGAGDLASSAVIAALDTIRSADTAAELLAQFEHRVIRANAEVRAVARSRALGLIGTTLAALLIRPPHYACLWCGDSRAYLWRDGGLAQISHDHSEVQDLIDRGILDAAEAKTWPRRNVVTRAIGVAVETELELAEGRVAAGDRFLLCSDGLTNHVDDAEIATALSGGGPKQACEQLVELTLQRGASDNVSLIVIACAFDQQTVRLDGAWRAEAAAAAPRAAEIE